MTAISFSGLASGLDTSSLIDKLVSAERSSADTLSSRQSDLNTQKSIVGSMSSALAAFGTAVRALDLDSEVKPRTATVSDTTVSAAVSSSAAPVVHDLRVKSLAAAQVTQSKAFAANAPGVLGAGGVAITVGGATKSVSWDATDTLDTIAQKLNDANAGVTASVLKVDASSFRLVVTAKDTGTAAAPTFVDSGSGLDLANAANIKVPAGDATVTIDGIDVTRPSNVIGDALPGVTLTLNSVGTANTKLAVSLDQKSLVDKLKAVVSAYNSVNAGLHVQLDYTGSTKGTNTLFGDSTFRGLQGSLGALVADSYGGSTLGALGISRDKTGAMTLDETKLASAIASDPDAVSKVFVTGGFASKVGTFTDSYTTSTTGILAAKSDGLVSRNKDLQTQIDRINANADALQTRLQAQFDALEKAMSNLQSQSGFISRILG